MKQSAAVRPEPTWFRKAAIAHGAALDHSGSVAVSPIEDFDLDRTIFQTLASPVARYVMAKRVGREVYWRDSAAQRVQEAYEATRRDHPLPDIDPALVAFLVDECDFDVEHADGSFLDHLYFCFEYAVVHDPDHSPLVMFLHSILGTGTNTFAMTADKIPQLRELVDDFEFRHIEAFPSILRLLYTDLLDVLFENRGRLDQLSEIRLHRVIDNQPIALSADDLWIALNFQLMHLVDFLPAANWTTHLNDTNFIVFRALHDLLSKVGKLSAKVDYTPARGPRRYTGEVMSPTARLITRIPVHVSWTMACRSIANFSEQCGHSLQYELVWGAE